MFNIIHYQRNANQNYNEELAFIENLQTINAGEGGEEWEPSCIVGGNVNWYSQYREQYGGSLKKLTIENLKYGFYGMGNALAPS